MAAEPFYCEDLFAFDHAATYSGGIISEEHNEQCYQIEVQGGKLSKSKMTFVGRKRIPT